MTRLWSLHRQGGALRIARKWMTAMAAVATGMVCGVAHADGTVPPPPVSPTPVTTYEYDAQGNPTKVTRAPGSLNLQTRATYDP